MKSVLFASGNPGKLAEMRNAFPFLSPQDSQFSHLQAPEVVEDGDTYHANAEKKARAYYAVYQIPVLSDDTGLEIDALRGMPGVHTAYFGGESLTPPQRWAFTLKALKPFPPNQWTARFRCVLCYFDGRNAQFFEGVTEGEIVPPVLGGQGFGYDPIFHSRELGKTFAEASLAEKQSVSHRGRALAAFLTQLGA